MIDGKSDVFTKHGMRGKFEAWQLAPPYAVLHCCHTLTAGQDCVHKEAVQDCVHKAAQDLLSHPP